MAAQSLSELADVKRLIAGPLSSHIDAFATQLSIQGYCDTNLKTKIRQLAHLGEWLHEKQLEVNDLNESVIDAFIEHRQKSGYVFHSNKVSFRALLWNLRNIGVIPVACQNSDDSAFNIIKHSFEIYLKEERNLSDTTLNKYLSIVHKFLLNRFGQENINLNEISPSDITKFILKNVDTVMPRYISYIASALRSFFRFLYLSEETKNDLTSSIPSVANWRLSELPKSLDPEQVDRLLACCNQNSTIGQRDYTILLLLARLGLRAGEIVAMTLDDINWETGELVIRGKGDKLSILPILQDVGEALSYYLRYGRPICKTRQVFVRFKAPHVGFSTSHAICDVVKRALSRAGIDSARQGAHLLRHSLATHMINKGATMAEIGEILRHSSPNTTEIYAKVNMAALGSLTQPWPGGKP